ncbi:MAG: CAP domain-containing protein [Lapillicoccus sp.]
MFNILTHRISSVLLTSAALVATVTVLAAGPASASARAVAPASHPLSGTTVGVKRTSAPVVTKPPAPAATPAKRPVTPPVVSPAAYAARLVTLTNQTRVRAGLPALASSTCLAPVASRWASSMATAHKMTHQSLNNLATACAGWRTVGENIAMGNVSADALFTAWLNSPEHKANILRTAYNQEYIAVFRDSRGFYWVTADFAQR